MWKTPLVRLNNVSRRFGLAVYGKIETVNPTGSHKDRESIKVVVDAIRKGYRSVGCASTGNAAISLAAYSLMKGLECHIYVPESISQERLTLIKAFRPKIRYVTGGYMGAVRKSNVEMSRRQIYNANPGTCAAKILGNFEIGKEIADQLRPDLVICPTNNGTHLTGVWMGLKYRGLRSRIVAATAAHTEIADSIHGFHKLDEPGLTKTLSVSKGVVVDVDDDEIIEALRLLVKDGIIAEPAAAASVAAINHLNTSKKTVCCCSVTGSGTKFPRLLRKVILPPAHNS